MRMKGLGPISKAIAREKEIALGASPIEPRRSRRRGRRGLPYIIESHDADSVKVTEQHGASFLIDKADWESLQHYRFNFARGRIQIFNLCKTGSNPILARHLLGALDHQAVDHINGDPSDNRRHNLRFCTAAENARNMALNRTNSTGFKGVSKWRGNMFRAYAVFEGKWRYLGSYHAAADAARAYDDFARSHFGAFACVNFPLSGEQSVHRRKGD